MINLLVGAIPGIVAALAVWLAAVGIRAWRYDPVQDVHPEELMDASVLGASQEKTKASVLSRLGARFVPLIKGSLPASIPRRLQRQIDLAQPVAARRNMNVGQRQIRVQAEGGLTGQRMPGAHGAHIAVLHQLDVTHLRVSVERRVDGKVQTSCRQVAGGLTSMS